MEQRREGEGGISTSLKPYNLHEKIVQQELENPDTGKANEIEEVDEVLGLANVYCVQGCIVLKRIGWTENRSGWTMLLA